jgi:hypothetical protein
MQRAAETGRRTCDCSIELLTEDWRRDQYFLRYIPWNAHHGYLYCDRHRVYVPVELERPAGTPPSPGFPIVCNTEDGRP